MSIKHESVPSTPLLRVGLIGDPVAHSYSPRLQQAALDALGIPARYELWQTSQDELPARVASLLDPHCMGANVTIPYKEAVLPLLDIVDPLATCVGAVNTIVHRDLDEAGPPIPGRDTSGPYLEGYNTDVPGLLQTLAEQGVGEPQGDAGWEAGMPVHMGADSGRGLLSPPATGASPLHIAAPTVSLRGYTAILLGAGGAARSGAFALVSAGVTRLIIVNRHLERAQRLAEEIQRMQPAADCQFFSLSDPYFLIPHPRSLIINATPVGMHVARIMDPGGMQTSIQEQEEKSPLPVEVLERFAPDTFVLDMVYNPVQTRFLCQARMLGLRCSNGLPMLLHQGALAFTLWTNWPAPLDVMRSALLR